MTPGEALELPLVQLGQALRGRKVTSAQLAQEALERLEKRARPLNAIAALLPDRALAEAKQADAELAAGKWRGPLHGVPFGAKDLVAAKGAPTTWGARWLKDRVIDQDAGVIERLRESGAVLVAKLSTVQLAGAFGYHRADASLFGPGKNPWDPARWAGGSSSGSAAAVAARCVPFAIGSETWGSILTPSALCGLAGLRPTFGRVSRAGVMALSYSLDKLGPLATRAEDALIALAGMSGHDENDPASVEGQPKIVPGRQGHRLKIGALMPDAMKGDAEVIAAHKRHLAELSKLADVVPIESPSKLPVEEVAQLILRAEEASAFEDFIDAGALAGLASTDGQASALADRDLRASDYVRAQRIRGLIRAELARFFETHDAIVTPALGLLGAVAPKLEDDFDVFFDAPDPVGAIGNLLGLPSVALPGPLVRGLPTALQLMGPAWSEETLVACATQLELKTGFAAQKPG
ncbi:MAG: amidase [Deltaproteobacteria bacterium]|nr:amidase [Deltaproteobacteria bacterium]